MQLFKLILTLKQSPMLVKSSIYCLFPHSKMISKPSYWFGCWTKGGIIRMQATLQSKNNQSTSFLQVFSFIGLSFIYWPGFIYTTAAGHKNSHKNKLRIERTNQASIHKWISFSQIHHKNNTSRANLWPGLIFI